MIQVGFAYNKGINMIFNRNRMLLIIVAFFICAQPEGLTASESITTATTTSSSLFDRLATFWNSLPSMGSVVSNMMSNLATKWNSLTSSVPRPSSETLETYKWPLVGTFAAGVATLVGYKAMLAKRANEFKEELFGNRRTKDPLDYNVSENRTRSGGSEFGYPNHPKSIFLISPVTDIGKILNKIAITQNDFDRRALASLLYKPEEYMITVLNPGVLPRTNPNIDYEKMPLDELVDQYVTNAGARQGILMNGADNVTQYKGIENPNQTDFWIRNTMFWANKPEERVQKLELLRKYSPHFSGILDTSGLGATIQLIKKKQLQQ